MDDYWPVDEAEADAIIVPYWQDIIEQFEESGYPQPATLCDIILTDEVRDSCRHFAATREDGKMLYLAPDIVHLPSDLIMGILAHEAGHIVDLQSPGIYWFRNDELIVSDELPSRGFRKILRAWRDRSDDEVERVADEIAFDATGVRIGYVGGSTCLVQALGRGIKRPKGLK
jgi:hypothetical protein